MAKLTVPGHRVLIKPKELVKKTESGIILNYGEDEERYAAATTQGVVVAIGPDAWKTMYINGYQGQPWAKVGDEVLFAKYVGKDVTDPETNVKYRVINDEDIVCVFEK